MADDNALHVARFLLGRSSSARQMALAEQIVNAVAGSEVPHNSWAFYNQLIHGLDWSVPIVRGVRDKIHKLARDYLTNHMHDLEKASIRSSSYFQMSRELGIVLTP